MQNVLHNLVYDESSRSCLRTKSGRSVGYIKKSKTSKNYSYWSTMISGKQYSVHRLIWMLFYGEIPQGMVINHIDVNSLNNKISNLELCSISENNKRQGQHLKLSVRPDNLLGKTGVKILTVKGYSYVVARIRINGKLYEKLFSVEKYGEELAITLACAEREKMLSEATSSGFRNSVV